MISPLPQLNVIILGNSGNNLIELTHALWVSNELNSTLVIPVWMNQMLNEFDLTTFFENYCSIMTFPANGLSINRKANPLQNKLQNRKANVRCVGCSYHELRKGDSFYVYRLYGDKVFQNLLPRYDQNLLKKLSQHLINVYASLWTSPSEGLIEASNHVISNYLRNDFNYTTVHKRAMEGGCSKIVSEMTSIGDYSSLELPMDNREWKGNLQKSHPMCEMTASFINETLHLHNKQNDPLFVSFDGRGDVTALRKYGAVFTSVLDKSDLHRKKERKYLDMFIAMQGDFFILNPRSTFSWQIFVIRTVLGLGSVPILKHKDFYMRNNVGADNITDASGVWISWGMILTAVDDMRVSLRESI